jgi:hypothetical protein
VWFSPAYRQAGPMEASILALLHHKFDEIASFLAMTDTAESGTTFERTIEFLLHKKKDKL